MALLEAMASGISIIATRVGGVPKIITNEKNGILIEAQDSNGLAQGVHKILKDDSLRNEIIKNARATVADKYNIKKWCREVEQLYVSIIEPN